MRRSSLARRSLLSNKLKSLPYKGPPNTYRCSVHTKNSRFRATKWHRGIRHLGCLIRVHFPTLKVGVSDGTFMEATRIETEAITESLPSPVMTVEQLAAYPQVHPSTVYQWAERDETPPGTTRLGGAWRFVKTKIDAWLEV